MSRSQLPEGVGKKIVEALRRQQEADITPVSTEENTISESIALSDAKEEMPELKFEQPVQEEAPSIETENDNMIIEEENNQAEMVLNIQEETAAPVQEELPLEDVQKEQPIFQAVSETPASMFTASSNVINNNVNAAPASTNKAAGNISTASIKIPANVAVLKNLISSLPVGVTKQTGAQIIRQTLEAMGLPMNNVLKEAQDVQEELNSSTRECMLKIQEFKTYIMQLEQSVQEYQKNITQINDLVSLFLLTDRK